MFKRLKKILFISLLFSFLVNSLAYSEKDNIDKHQEDINVVNKALDAAELGPITVSLLDQATINIPENYLFVPAREAASIMHVIGNQTDENFVGLILNRYDDLRWFITIDFIKSGFIKDNDAKSWNANDLLKSLKEGTERENAERVQNGIPPLHVLNWIEKPTYNSSAHQLVWSMLAKEEGSSESTVNYNTYALGRDGYFQFNLVTSESAITKYKIHAKEILSALHFNNGKLYTDFVDGEDKIAEYGVAALITGIVAKKLGLFAMAGVFLIKIWKFLILIPLLLGSKIKSLFRRNKKSANSL